MPAPLRATRAEINLKNLAHNMRSFRSLVAERTTLMAVVKADGYGHGSFEIADTALKHGAERLGVAFVEEGISLRKKGITAPILVLGTPFIDQAGLFFDFNLNPTIFTKELAECFAAEARRRKVKIKVQIKVDTGMGRIGIFPHEAASSFAVFLKSLLDLEVEGIYTHFATADEKDKTYSRKQLARFRAVIADLKEKEICPPLVHAANSAATMELPESWFDLVRIGISMYGHYPSEEVNKSTLPLKPLMSLKSRVAFVKEVPAGTAISYGRTYITPGKTLVATIPLGYGDGFNRLLSNRGRVLIRENSFPIIGRVCMDQFLVDVTGAAAVEAGDEVVLFGEQGSEQIPVEELASLLETINYEVLCAVGKRVPRVYI